MHFLAVLSGRWGVSRVFERLLGSSEWLLGGCYSIVSIVDRSMHFLAVMSVCKSVLRGC